MKIRGANIVNGLSGVLLVRKQERPDVLYFAVFYLLLGCGMALGRGTADALFFKRYGIEYLPVMFLFVSVLMMLMSTAYAAYADRFPPERLFKILFVVLVGILSANWALMVFTDWRQAYPLYFLVYEVASELLIIHAALYIGRNLNTQQLKRLSPLIFASAQVGTLIGGMLLATASPLLGVQNILVIWVGLLALSLTLLFIRHTRLGTSPYFRHSRKGSGQLKRVADDLIKVLKFTKQSELLRTISLAFFFMVIAFYILAYSVNRVYNATFQTEEALSSFFGGLTAASSLLGLGIQVLLTNRLLRKHGVKKMNLVFPAAILASFGSLLLVFALPAAILGSFIKDALMPSIRNPVKNLFFNALPNHIQGRARALSIALIMPAALSITGLILLQTQKLQNPLYFLWPGAAAAVLYVYFSLRMNRAYVASIVSSLREKVLLARPDSNIIDDIKTEDVFQELEMGVDQPNDMNALCSARMLVESFPERAPTVLLRRIKASKQATREQLIDMLAPFNSAELCEQLLQDLPGADDAYRASILNAVFARRYPGAEPLVVDALRSSHTGTRAAGVNGVMCYGLQAHVPEATGYWQDMLNSQHAADNLLALSLLARHATLTDQPEFVSLLEHDDDRVIKAALDVLHGWTGSCPVGLANIMAKLGQHTDREIRVAAMKQCRCLPEADRALIIEKAIHDNHPLVSATAIELLFSGGTAPCDDVASWISENRASPRAQQAAMTLLLGQEPAAAVWKHIAVTKAQDAHAIARAIHSLKQDTTTMHRVRAAMELVIYALHERHEQSVDLALTATEQIEDPYTIGVVRAGLKTGDSQHIANACEVLRYIEDKDLLDLLGSVLDDVADNTSATSAGTVTFEDARDALQWCRRRADPWLAECAGHALQTFAEAGA
ncbi:MAG: hypothetical protein PVF75_02550 [Granulosicoccaceae bacterium]